MGSLPLAFRPRVFPLPGPPRLGDWLAALCRRDRSGVALLDSAGGAPRRHSVLGFDPLERVLAARGDDPFGILQRALRRLASDPGDPVPGPFHGGFLGALAYDAGVQGEGLVLPAPALAGPLLAGGLYVDFVVVDHARDAGYLVLGDAPGDGRPCVAERRRELESLFAEPVPPPRVDAGALRRHTRSAAFRDVVQRAREEIARGDYYQVNLAHRFSASLAGAPSDLYRVLRRVNPAPYMGFLSWDDGGPGALLSCSPELLFEFDGQRARTRPIKGTAARGSSPESDARAIEGLIASEKDLAELTMIVDLERNDLGRVARIGSVRVDGLPTVESYASVHHLVADVRAEVRPGIGALDVLGALFPGGSITGAPKLAAMGAIARLEGAGRGFFTGSMGFLDSRGQAAFNVLIRTLEWRADAREEGHVSYHVGGGITWSSDPAAEDAETLAKGAAMARALGPQTTTETGS